MKNISYLFVVIILVLNSCIDKVVKSCGSTCEVHGFCDVATGTCDCDLGYEGANCDVETRARFLGAYAVKQDSSGSIKNYTCIISNGPASMGPYAITISSLNGSSLDCTVSANNSLNVELGNGGGFFNVSGSGLLNGNTITLNCTFDPTGSAATYNMAFTLTK